MVRICILYIQGKCFSIPDIPVKLPKYSQVFPDHKLESLSGLTSIVKFPEMYFQEVSKVNPPLESVKPPQVR
jgi:hypothetical protein